MAENINANIRINLETAEAAAQLRLFETQISNFNKRVVQSNTQAVAAQRQAMSMLQDRIGDIGKFSTQITTIETSVGRFSKALDRGKLSFGEYFRYGMASTKTFRRAFTQEMDMIDSVAEDRVKRISTRYVALGDAAQGTQKVLAIRPEVLPDNMATQLAMAAQRQQIFNQLLRQGSTHLVNWGKNTQWAGRQLMVGFTIPLTIFGGIAAKTFRELEEQAIAFRKVYGDIFTTDQEVEDNLQAVRDLSAELTKYGIAVRDTFELANTAAQAGARGADLIAQTTEATRLAVLGQMEQQEAIMTTITLQNAFQLSNEELSDSINFLNIVENQSVLSLQDVSGAIPRVAPVIKSLGGDVRDLAVFLTAMREGGVTAAEGANALKTSLARLISPTTRAIGMAEDLGINLNQIVEGNQGDILAAVMELAQAMESLDQLSQQRLLSEIFGKRQYARVGALFNNITNEASQAQRVLELTTMSTEDLATTAERELGQVEQSIATKFASAVEKLQLAIAPIGETFLRIAIPIIDAVSRVVDAFNGLPQVVKNTATIITVALAGIAPVFLMGIGLIANGVGNLIKGLLSIRGVYQRIVARITGQTSLLTQSFGYVADSELDAAAAAGTLEGRIGSLTESLMMQESVARRLADAYRDVAQSMAIAAAQNPQGFMTRVPGRTTRRRGFARGGQVGGSGSGDTVPAMLTPGEFVVNADAAQAAMPLLEALNSGQLQGFANGGVAGGGAAQSRRMSGNVGIVQSHVAGATIEEFGRMLASIVDARESLGRFGQALTEETTTVYRLVDVGDNWYEISKQTGVALKDLQEDFASFRVGTPFFEGAMVPSVGARNELLSQLPGNPGEPLLANQLFALETSINDNRASLEGFDTEIDQIMMEASQLRSAMNESADAEWRYAQSKLEAILEAEQLRTRGVSAEEAKANAQSQAAQIVSEMRLVYEREEDSSIALVRAHQEAIAGLQFFANASRESGQELIIATENVSNTALRNVALQRTSGPVTRGGEPAIATYERPRRVNPVARGVTPSSAGIKVLKAAEWEQIGTEAGIIVGQSFETNFGNAVAEASVKAGEKIRPNVSKGADAQSPPPWSNQLGNWIGIGINQGMEETILPPSVSRGAVLLGGPGEPGGPPIGPISQMDDLAESTQNATSALILHETAAKDDALSNEKNSISTKENSVATEVNTEAVKVNSREQKRGIGGFRGMLYAVDGLSLAMSFLPGPIGDIANKFFIASAALTAFDSIMRIQLIQNTLPLLQNAIKKAALASGLTAAAQGVRAATVASTAGDVALAASLARGGGRGGAIAKLFGPLGRVVAPITKIFGSLGRVLPAIGRLVPAFARFAGILVNMVPGWGQLASIIILLTTSIVGFSFAYKNAGDKINDLAKAAGVAKDELKGIADAFGFTQRTTGFENISTVLGRTEEARGIAQEAQQFVSEDSAMQDRVSRVRRASGTEAEAIFRSLFADLLAGGAPRDVAVAIVEAVANEAGKEKAFVPVITDIEVAFDDEGKIKDIANFINDSLDPGIRNLEQSFEQLQAQGFDTFIDQGAIDDAKRWMAAVDPLPGFLKKAIVPQYEQKQAILETASSFELLKTNTFAAMKLLSSQFVNGSIDISEFNQGIGQVEQSLSRLPENRGLEVVKAQLAELYPEAKDSVESIKDLDIAFGILNLQAQGINMYGFIQQLGELGLAADEVRAKLQALISVQNRIASVEGQIAQVEADLAAEEAKPGRRRVGEDEKGGGGGGTKDPFAEAEDEFRDRQAKITIQEIEIDRQAEERFRKTLERRLGESIVAVGDLEIELDTMADAEYAIEQIGEKIEDLENGPIRQWEEAIEGINDEIKVYQDELDAINRDIELQEQEIEGIERAFKPILDNLQKQRSEHEKILQSLEDEIEAQVRPIDNRIAELEREARVAEEAAKPRLESLEQEEKALDNQIENLDDQIDNIDRQKDALNKVARANEYIARQQKNQLNLSRAISEGDIYAATEAARQMREESASQAAEQQQEAFDEQKNQIEEEKRAINDRKEAIQDERDLIQERIDAINEEIEAQEYQKFLIEDSYRLRLQAVNDAIKDVDREIEKQEDLKAARIAPYQEIIDSYGPQITALNNAIYDKEVEIKKIEDERLTPLRKQVTELGLQSGALEDIIDDTNRSIRRDKAHLEERKKFLDQELQILAARRELADLSTGGGGGGAEFDEGTRDPKKIKELRTRLAELQSELAELRKQMAAELPEAVSDAGFMANIVTNLQSAWSGFTTWFSTNITQPIKDQWNSIKDDVTAIVETIGALFVALFDLTIKPKVEELQKAWETVRLNFTTKFNEIKTFFTTWWSTTIEPRLGRITEVWEKVREKFEEKFGEIQDFFATWWEENVQTKLDAIVNVWEDVKAAFITAFEAIGEWWSEWKRLTFDEKVEEMKSGLESLFDPETWKGWFENAAEAVLGAGKTLVNELAELFNKIQFTIPEWIPWPGDRGFGINIPTPYPGFYAGGKVEKMRMGGIVPYAMGGYVGGTGSRDSVPAMLTPGEFVIRKAMVDKYGSPLMEAINQGAMPRYDIPSESGELEISNMNNIMTSINAPVYNTYDMKFSINGTNQSADEIANTVMFKMKQLQSQGIRSNRGY